MTPKHFGCDHYWCLYCGHVYDILNSDAGQLTSFCSLNCEADYYVSEQRTDEILKEMEEQHRGDL